MKKLLLLLLLGLAPNLMMAQTAKAIWCAGNSTLYFTYDNTTYSAGGTYDGQTITNVYAVSGSGYDTSVQYAPWWDIRTSIVNIVISSSFFQFSPTSLKQWFFGLRNLANIVGSENLNISNVTDLNGTFMFCSKLICLDVSNWDTSNVTTLRATFYGCLSLTSLDVSRWDTSKVTDMSYTFSGCSSLSSLGICNWNTNNVTNMSGTFVDCSSLTSLDVSKWDVSKVTEMMEIFRGCSSLNSLDIGDWDTSRVTTLEESFKDCSSLTTLNLNEWDTNKVTKLKWIFKDCSNLTSLNVSNWDTSNVTTMEASFSGCSRLISFDVSHWDTSKVTNMIDTFSGCSSLTSLDVNSWDTGNVILMSGTFSNCSSLMSLDISNWNTSNVITVKETFYNCSNLKNVIFGKNFDMSKVTSAERMFWSSPKLRYIDFYDSDDIDAISVVKRSTNNNDDNMFYGVPFTTIIYLPHGCQTVTIDGGNIVYSYNGDEMDLRCAGYYSENNIDIEIPRKFKTNRASYSRTMSSTYGSVVLPYDFTSNSDIQAFTLDEEHVGSMTFKNATTVPAHTPFAFQKLASGSTASFVTKDATGNFGITVQATRDTKDNPYTATTNLTGWTTKGYYVAQTVDDYSDAFYISNDKIYKADGPLTLYPHRVTFHGTWTQGTPGTGAKSLEIADMATCITPIDNSQLTIDNYYDLSGRRVQSNKVTGSQSNMLPKGIYIVNGKKMVVK